MTYLSDLTPIFPARSHPDKGVPIPNPGRSDVSDRETSRLGLDPSRQGARAGPAARFWAIRCRAGRRGPSSAPKQTASALALDAG